MWENGVSALAPAWYGYALTARRARNWRRGGGYPEAKLPLTRMQFPCSHIRMRDRPYTRSCEAFIAHIIAQFVLRGINCKLISLFFFPLFLFPLLLREISRNVLFGNVVRSARNHFVSPFNCCSMFISCVEIHIIMRELDCYGLCEMYRCLHDDYNCMMFLTFIF